VIAIVQLGIVDYATGLKLQQTLGEMRHADRIPNVLLLLEHLPVITLGRNADRRNILASSEMLTREGVEVFECNRGGDVTYHGPGQLVGYPIFDLRSFQRSGVETQGEAAGLPVNCQSVPAGGVRPAASDNSRHLGAIEYVRRLEEALIRTCADFGVAAGRVPKLTGVWTAPSASSSGREPVQAKIAAIGVHISRGITSHGFALNVNSNLDHFKWIVPCGIASKPVTSLSKERDSTLPLDAVCESVARNFGRVFNSQILWVETLDALLGSSSGLTGKAPEKLRKLHREDGFFA
jgi:lipoyl(octanoyl) transferase